jgi:hypothetical protein
LLPDISHIIFEHVNQFYNFTGLLTFKEKFHTDQITEGLRQPVGIGLQGGQAGRERSLPMQTL